MEIITTQPINAEELIQKFNFPHCGAIVSFEGRVRNHHQGRDVERLLYEAYIPMAEKMMSRLMQEIKTTWPDCVVHAKHRIGTLAIGDIAVVVVVWAPHRKEAFDACETMIDKIKEHVPIWKKETYKDGQIAWVGCGAHDS